MTTPKLSRMLFVNPQEIAQWLNEREIKNFVIHPDLSVEVRGHVDLSCNLLCELGFSQLSYLPLNFSTVHGSFNVQKNYFTSLEGFPQTVVQDFNIEVNNIKSLVGGPTFVGGNYKASYNRLDSLAGIAIQILGDCILNNNNIVSLEFCPKEIIGDFSIDENQLTSLEFYPESLGGNFACCDNPIKTLAGFDLIMHPNTHFTSNGIQEINEHFGRPKNSLEYLQIDEKNLRPIQLAIQEKNKLSRLIPENQSTSKNSFKL